MKARLKPCLLQSLLVLSFSAASSAAPFQEIDLSKDSFAGAAVVCSVG
jgi:hypothetical protein